MSLKRKSLSPEQQEMLKKRKTICLAKDESYADLFNRWAQWNSPQISAAFGEMCADIYDMYDDEEEDEERPEMLILLKRGQEVGLLDALVLPRLIKILKEDEDRDLSLLVTYLETL